MLLSQLSLSNTQAVAGGDAGYLSFMVTEPPSCTPNTQNDSPNTVTLDPYSEVGCCNSIETIKIGNLDVCHDSNAPLHSLSHAVGLDMFGWLYHIHPYTGTGCTGTAGNSISLSTQHGIAWNSFKITQDCKHITPPASSDTTVALALYQDGTAVCQQ